MSDLSYFSSYLQNLKKKGNYRTFPAQSSLSGEIDNMVDFSSNDYMGLRGVMSDNVGALTSSASRLLATDQRSYALLEQMLEQMYGRPALLFNSGYHANTGIIPALTVDNTLIVSDKLVHASIIDGIRLCTAREKLRFRHNDMDSLQRILQRHHGKFDRVLVVTESVFSMDGDRAPLLDMIELKRLYPEVMLYVDIAHSIGVEGPGGIGLNDERMVEEIDIIVGTFGKAVASMGAFVSTSEVLVDYLRNTARSLIFSTALPPRCILHTLSMLRKLAIMNDERAKLQSLSDRLRTAVEELTGKSNPSTSHIVPLVIGDAEKAVSLSMELRSRGFLALPIRRPTVPAGTERLRFSLSAAHTDMDIDRLIAVLKESI